MAVVMAPNAAGNVVTYTKPSALAFESTGALANGVLTISSPCPTFTTADCTAYPPGSLTNIKFNNMTATVTGT